MLNHTKNLFSLFNRQLYLSGKFKAIIGLRCCSFLTNSPLKVKVRDIALDKYVMGLENEYFRLKTRENSPPDQLKRLSELELIMNILQKRCSIIKDIENLKDLMDDNDEEIKRLAEEEQVANEDKVEEIEKELLEALLPNDPSDCRSSIMLEVNAGVGGQEAMLFAKELFYMYCSFAQYKKWNIEIVGYQTAEVGGLRHGVALIHGENAFKYFKFEGGVHRVQRIPATEKAGRVHTSTVSVVILPEPTEIEVAIDNKDLRIETKRASGAGGQHVNTTDSAVRITHIPSGVSVDCQTDRSQMKNKKVAMQKLRSILYERQLTEQNEMLESTKKSQVNSNFRNEKIRTYNFSQDRITDHRLHTSNIHNIKGFFAGTEALERLMNHLHTNGRFETLLAEVTKLNSK